MHEIEGFFEKIYYSVRPAIALTGTILTYLILPEESFIPWCIALWVAVALDLLTRWFAIFMNSGGVAKAFKTKAFNSDTMFRKTAVKIVAYLVIQILAGLSMRLVSLPYISNFIATVIYSFLFFREFASNIENLIEAGASDLKPLLFWIKKQEKEVLEKDKEREKK